MKRLAITGFILTVGIMFTAGSTWADPINASGKTLMAVDGAGDADSVVNSFIVGFTTPYTLGYFIDGDYLNFHTLSLGNVGTPAFGNGQMIDLALVSGGSIFTASGIGSTDPGVYSAMYDFAGPNLAGYSTVNITWTFSDQTAFVANIGAQTAYDGFVPVPEASTLLLLGSGLATLGLWNKRKREFARK